MPYVMSVFKIAPYFLLVWQLIPTLEDFSIAHVEKHWQFTHHVQGHITHSERPTRRSHLNKVAYTKITIKFEIMLFTKKINVIILGDMTRPAGYLNSRYSEVHHIWVLLYFLNFKNASNLYSGGSWIEFYWGHYHE